MTEQTRKVTNRLRAAGIGRFSPAVCFNLLHACKAANPCTKICQRNYVLHGDNFRIKMNFTNPCKTYCISNN